jgi:subtilisin family serine protease
VEEAIRRLERNPNVRFAEPNWKYNAAAVSNDTYYTSGQLWGMYGDDLPTAVGPAGTTNQYGSQAEKAWNDGFTGSSNVYVGIIDEGFQYAHPDLAANSWTNPFDPLDGIDNDGNGYVDDIHGWDFFSNDNSTYDGTGDDHGTHVAGTIGGQGGNGAGVAGVNWSTTMISTKFLGPSGGFTADAIEALDYLTDLKVRHGINIVASNNSWGGGGFSQGLLDAIVRAANQGILFVAAAGNSNVNNDTTASYPSNYSTVGGAGYEAVIAVASITSTGAKSSFSSYGATTVDLGAPGSAIISSVPDSTYASYSGTSMATPHVTGAAALYASKYPGASANDIRNAILSGARATTSMSGITVTGGRLDVYGALAVSPPGGGNPNITINDVSVAEGNSPSTTSAVFTVSLSAAPSQTVTVSFATANGSATGGSDFIGNSGTLTFLPGDPTTQTVNVTVNGDNTAEGNESFFVNLTGATNATITDAQGVGTIVDDDMPTIVINNVSLNEGRRNSKTFTFTVSLSAPASQAVSVNYATANGTATAGSDYASKAATLVIPVGASSRTIGITVYGDNLFEPNETFFVNLSAAVNGVIADNQGVGTILNDDKAQLLVSGPVPTNRNLVADVSSRDLVALLSEAKSRWIVAGETTAPELRALNIQIRVADLPGRTLGMADGNTIWIDRNAARFGWYVDASPSTDAEFRPTLNSKRVDLLSVIGHELGHVLGLDHDDDHDGMQATLAPGERHLPASAVVAGPLVQDWSNVGLLLARSGNALIPSNANRTSSGQPVGSVLNGKTGIASFVLPDAGIRKTALANSRSAAALSDNEISDNTTLIELDRLFANKNWFAAGAVS